MLRCRQSIVIKKMASYSLTAHSFVHSIAHRGRGAIADVYDCLNNFQTVDDIPGRDHVPAEMTPFSKKERSLIRSNSTVTGDHFRVQTKLNSSEKVKKKS